MLLARGHYEDAEPLYSEALAIRQKRLPEAHSAIAMSRSGLGAVRTAQGKYQEAQALLTQAWSVIGESKDTTIKERADVLERLARLYENWQKADPGEGYEAQAAKWRKRLADLRPPSTQPKDHR